MRIYAVADIHGRSNRVAILRETVLQSSPDLLVVAGDITGYIDSSGVLSSLNDLSVPVLAVRGNADRLRLEKRCSTFPSITSLHLEKIAIQGVTFVGVGGTVPVPFNTRFRFREGDMEKVLLSMVERDSILITHPPPFGVRDEVLGRFHAGCRCLARVIKKRQPKLCICGHIHERSGVGAMGDTLVVNCNMAGRHRGALIDCKGAGDPVVTMLS